jgi:ArsR family metal-binding transcriptional regulator
MQLKHTISNVVHYLALNVTNNQNERSNYCRDKHILTKKKGEGILGVWQKSGFSAAMKLSR